ncbi:hypothetical protein B0H13DRAFT_2318998 [Mycena leptocephala]|nr:hypothetical protein B0H13DRAFT_2318998 [Mycena leptocephala]
MVPLGPFLKRGSVEDQDCQNECRAVNYAWRTRDRRAIKTYQQLVEARTLKDARIACSKAVASMRSASYNQFEFSRWLEEHLTGKPSGDPFGGATHFPGVWHSYRNSDGSWGPWGGTMDASRWVPDTRFTEKRVIDRTHCPWGMGGRPWGPSGGLPGRRDPNWDGVPVPKTPGKAKRRKLLRRQLLEQALEEEAAFTLSNPPGTEVAQLSDGELRAAGWGTPAWGVPGWGWGPDWSSGGCGLWASDGEGGGNWEAARSRL